MYKHLGKMPMDYAEFKRKVDAFKNLLLDTKKGHIELLILDLINEHSPNFMHYKALEMIEEGDFDDDVNVRGYFKRLLWDEVIEEQKLKVHPNYSHMKIGPNKELIFKTDEEIIEELNKSDFLADHPGWIPMKPGATQEFFDKQMEQSMCSIVEHPYPNQDSMDPCLPVGDN